MNQPLEAYSSLEANYLTFAVLFDSHTVAGVPVTAPVTLTAMNLPFMALVTANFEPVALAIFLQDLGTILTAVFTCAEQEYHW